MNEILDIKLVQLNNMSIIINNNITEIEIYIVAIQSPKSATAVAVNAD